MKIIVILLMALSLFGACNNDKGRDNKNADYREKDDYGNNDDQSNEKSRKDDDRNSNENTTSDGWTEKDKSKFLSDCIGGFGDKQALGKKVCACALDKFEKKYTSLDEANKKGGEADGERMGKECVNEMNINTNNDDNNSNEVTDNDKSNYAEKGWPAFEVRDYVTSCVGEAIKSGMNKYDAQSYCECMQVKMEKKFPDIKVAGRLSEEEIVSISKKFAPGCLEEH
jgi:hypothetical protein